MLVIMISARASLFVSKRAPQFLQAFSKASFSSDWKYSFSYFENEKGIIKLERDKVGDNYTGVTLMTLNKPEKLNCLNLEMGKHFYRAVKALKHDQNTNAVVITGAGRAFSAGGDLEWLDQNGKTADATQNQEALRKFYHLFAKIREFDGPVISAINGPAVGGGMCLAMLSDIRLMAQKAYTGFPFSKLGICPGMGSTYLLSKLCGPQHAMRILLCDHFIGAEEAVAIGWAMKCVAGEPHAVVEQGVKLARRMVSPAESPLTVRTGVRAIRSLVDVELYEAYERDAAHQALSLSSADIREGLRAHQEKRATVFDWGLAQPLKAGAHSPGEDDH